jgi:hypothetical protein
MVVLSPPAFLPARGRALRLVGTALLMGTFATVAATGCTGEVGDPAGMPGDQPPPITTGAGGTGAVADPNAAGPVALQRLSNQEYNNTVRDLLGDTSQPAGQFPSDHDPAFVFPRPGAVAVQDATLLRTAAEALAATAVKNVTRQPAMMLAPTSSSSASASGRSVGRSPPTRPIA